MGYQLKMSAEIYDWLSELRDSDPPTAILAAQALTALADGGDRLGPPLVAAVAAVRPRSDELAPALDQHYQDQLESLTAVRRRVAQVATLRKTSSFSSPRWNRRRTPPGCGSGSPRRWRRRSG